MSTTFVNSLALGLVLTMSPVAFARTRTGPKGETELEITLGVYNYAQVPASELAQAENGTARIFRQAGIKTRWLDCSPAGAGLKMNSACDHIEGSVDLRLNILPGSMARRWGRSDTTMGVSFLSSDGRRGTQSFVFYHWVEWLAEEGYAPREAILAHTMAHEIGHLLLGTNSHFPVGIMRADWTDEDLKHIGRDGLHFTSEQAGQMRHSVQARIEYEALAAK
jgi:hypothetical protein